jgi:hypothetical protein
MEASAQPVAKADIPLDDETRKRIAQDLGLSEDQLDAVPKSLAIARYSDEGMEGDDVSGFLFNQLSPSVQSFGTGGGAGLTRPGAGLQVGKIPGGLLLPV